MKTVEQKLLSNNGQDFTYCQPLPFEAATWVIYKQESNEFPKKLVPILWAANFSICEKDYYSLVGDLPRTIRDTNNPYQMSAI